MADLRYPANVIRESTDFLQIVVKQYVAGSILSSSTSSLPGNIAHTIILPMPSTIQDGNAVSYSDDSLDPISAQLAGSAGTLMKTKPTDTGIAGYPAELAKVANAELAKLFKESGNYADIITKNLAAQAASIFGGNVTANQLLARESGQILNPNLELLFNGVSLRSFKFSFKMTPRSKEEADNIKLIIYTLKRNMAAKNRDFFLETPNVFELSYRKGTGEHPFLHQFKPCALTDMSVNYTGEGIYATYSDGNPISLIIDLSFKELFPIYESDYDNAGTTVGL